MSYLGQFAVQNIETWQTNSSTGSTAMAIKNSVSMATHSFWDDIPVDLKNLNAFKFAKKLKHYLLSEQHSETLS